MTLADHVRTVAIMRCSDHLDRLRGLPALRRCSRRQLVEIGRLVDVVCLTEGATIVANDRQVVIALEPMRALVVDRRAVATLRELAPDLLGAGR